MTPLPPSQRESYQYFTHVIVRVIGNRPSTPNPPVHIVPPWDLTGGVLYTVINSTNVILRMCTVQKLRRVIIPLCSLKLGSIEK
jgi:hypothetical protein